MGIPLYELTSYIILISQLISLTHVINWLGWLIDKNTYYWMSYMFLWKKVGVLHVPVYDIYTINTFTSEQKPLSSTIATVLQQI